MEKNSDDSNIVGSCVLMCPKREEAMRQKSDRLHYFEKKGIVVKEFLRVGAGNTVDPEDLRTPTVLVHTLTYLINRLCEEDCENYSQPINTKHLNECLVKLHQLYKNQKEAVGEVEFVSCRLLTCLGSHEVILDVLTKSHLRSNKTILLVLGMNLAFIRGNYIRVFKLSRSLPPLLACAFHLKLYHLRVSFLRVMSAAYSVKNLTFPLDSLMKLMLFNEDSEKNLILKLLESCCIDVIGNRVLFDNKKFVEPNSMEQRRNSWIDSLLQAVPNISEFLLGDQHGLLDCLEKLSL